MIPTNKREEGWKVQPGTYEDGRCVKIVPRNQHDPRYVLYYADPDEHAANPTQFGAPENLAVAMTYSDRTGVTMPNPIHAIDRSMALQKFSDAITNAMDARCTLTELRELLEDAWDEPR